TGGVNCAVIDDSGPPVGGPDREVRRCSVDGWGSVVFIVLRPDPSARRLLLHTDDPTPYWGTCAPERFSSTVTYRGGMEAQIMAERCTTLDGGPFAGSYLVTSVVFTDGGCSVIITSAAFAARDGIASECRAPPLSE